ncbi:MAG TPA: YMGG-like glycine zipper-containing protein [Chitinophagaceae bacterium]|nr:YMGG-like glycine zipper-containing protein [Chitinophagaceae bacterium]
MRILKIFALAALFAACDSNKLDTEKDVITTDTSTMYNSNASTDTAISTPTVTDPVPAAPVKTITRTKTVYVDRTPKSKTINRAPVSNNSNNSVPVNTGTSSSAGTGTTGTSGPGTTTAPTTQKKPGMSNSTKGAIIGGAAGAVGGAIISKKKGKGAIIGGVIGAAGGYILGRKKDKKDTIQ